MDSTGLRQRLRFELQGLHSRDLEQQCIGSIRNLLSGVRGGSLFRVAVCELLSGLELCPRPAVKLRLQLAEYCTLKCASKAQLCEVLPRLMKQARTILACHLDPGCVSSLAAFLSSTLAKVLHNTPVGDDIAWDGSSRDSSPCHLELVCEAMLVPIIQSTYRDPEQSRVSAGAVVLSGMMEVLKACMGQSCEVRSVMYRCLVLMVQVLGQGSLVLKVPGVLDPVCVCLEALGDSIGQKVPKRLLQLCQKAAATKENWQVRRDAMRTVETLVMALSPGTSSLQGSHAESPEVCGTAYGVLVNHKQMLMQLLENARYDKIAAVRVAAVAALAKVSKLPDLDAQSTSDSTAGSTGITISASEHRKLRGTAPRAGNSGITKLALVGARRSSHRKPAFVRPQYPSGTLLDYGVQVFAPPSPPKHHTSAVSIPDVPTAESSPVRRQLDFDTKAASSSRESKLASASPQNHQDHREYIVHSAASTPHTAGNPSSPAEGDDTVCSCAKSAAKDRLQVACNDTWHSLDQTQYAGGLSAILASTAGSPARLDISHHIHGRVEVGIVYSPMSCPLAVNDAATLAAAALEPSNSSLAHADRHAAKANTVRAGAAAETGNASQEQCLWPQQVSVLQQQQPETPDAVFRSQPKGENVIQQEQWSPKQFASAGIDLGEPSFSTALSQHDADVLSRVYVSESEVATPTAIHLDAEAQHVTQTPQEISASCVSGLADDQVHLSHQSEPQLQAAELLGLLRPAVTVNGQDQGQLPCLHDGPLTAMQQQQQQHHHKGEQQYEDEQPVLISNNDDIAIAVSNVVDSAAKPSQRARQRWQLPEADMSVGSTALDELALAAGASIISSSPVCVVPLAGTSEAVCWSADGTASSKPGDPQPCSVSNMVATEDAHRASTSLAVLRTVGQQVQGLLEALCSSAADSDPNIVLCSSSATGSIAAGHSQEPIEIVTDGPTQLAASHASVHCCPSSTLDCSDTTTDDILVRQQVLQAADSPVASQAACALEVTAPQLQQVAVFDGSPQHSQCPCQPSIDHPPQQSAMSNDAYPVRECTGTPTGGERPAGMAQVEVALQKLHKLRSTLHSIGTREGSSQLLAVVGNVEELPVSAASAFDNKTVDAAPAYSDGMAATNSICSGSEFVIAAISQHQQPQLQTAADQLECVDDEPGQHQAVGDGGASLHSNDGMYIALTQQAVTGELPLELGPSSGRPPSHDSVENALLKTEQPHHSSTAEAEAGAAINRLATILTEQSQQPDAELQPPGEGHTRLQQMLDASDDVALLMSLSFKLGSLARRFKCQHGLSTSSPSLVLQPLPSHGAHTSNRDNTSHTWTSVLDNGLYVSSPSKSYPSMVGLETLSYPDQHETSWPLATEQPADMCTDAAESGVCPQLCNKAVACAGVKPVADHCLPEVQDAALRQVLDIGLPELLAGGEQVQQQLAHYVRRATNQLQVYSNQPPPFHGCCSEGASVLDRPAAVVAQAHPTDKVQSVLVLLLHEHQEAVRQQCRDMVLKEAVHQQHLPLGWWEESARMLAEQQVSWFAQHHLPQIMQILHTEAGLKD